MQLTDRHIVITGASRGIGCAWAHYLASRGSQVTACCRNPESATSIYEGTGISLQALDVTDDASCAAFAARLQGTPIDILINNAGIFGSEVQSIHQTTGDELRAIHETNVLGPIRVTAALYPLLRAAPQPLVVNISSGVGSIGQNQRGGMVGYRMSKAALNMLTKTLSIDEPELTVVSLHPGWVRTDMGGSNADLSVEESVESMTRTLEKIGPADSGRFYHIDGTDLPW